MAPTSKVRRVLDLLCLLLGHEHWTSEQLAKRLGCTPRTIFRDLQVLEDLGVPLERDPKFGIRALPSAVLRPLNFTQRELLALHVAAESGALRSSSPFDEALEEALNRIRATTGPPQRRLAQRLRGRISFEPRDTSTRAPADLRKKLNRAIEEQRPVGVLYRSVHDRGLIETDLEPYGLTFRRHAWYVVGRASLFGEVRVFRLDRFERVELIPGQFLPPSGFSVEEFFRDSWEVHVGPAAEVRIRFATELRPVLEGSVQHPSQKLEVEKDGSLLLSVTVAGLDEIERWVLGFGAAAEVLHPPELRRRLKETAGRLTGLYRDDR